MQQQQAALQQAESGRQTATPFSTRLLSLLMVAEWRQIDAASASHPHELYFLLIRRDFSVPQLHFRRPRRRFVSTAHLEVVRRTDRPTASSGSGSLSLPAFISASFLFVGGR